MSWGYLRTLVPVVAAVLHHATLLEKLGSDPSDEFLGNLLFDVESWTLHQGREVESVTAVALRILSCYYLTTAGKFYKKTKDPLGGSRMILTLLKLNQILDRLACKKFPLLIEHSSYFKPEIINCLLLPSKFELGVAQELVEYFHHRDEKATFPALINQLTITEDSFAVRFAQRDEGMCVH